MRLEYSLFTRLVLNLLFWVFYFVYPFLRFRYTGEHSITVEEIVFYLLLYGSVLYLNNLVLLPRYLQNHHIKKYLLTLLPILVAVAFFEAYVNKTLLKTCSCEGPNSTYALFNFIHLGVLLIMFSAVPLIRHYSTKLKALEKAETERLEAELKFLKAQVNPHMLFNSLNSIYAQALKNAKETPEMVLKLSDLLRYMLYEADKPRVELEKEVDYLNDYISLQQLRKSGIQVDFLVEGKLEDYSIAPMILINFLENAFKYIDPFNLKIDLELKAADNSIYFRCKNHFTHKLVSLGQADEQEGLGIKNAKKLLNALYPNKHELNIEKGDGIFTVALKLEV
ncbi:sensor histidine kinase [Roseivirga pacifica]|uniref:sensor histidine kinase n=1 Tax=Roseivirga pacifica TaxID=1267423 RepID=UPI003BA9A4AD